MWIVITRRGKPIAEVVPYREEKDADAAEIPLKDIVVSMGAIFSPVAEEE